MAFLTIPTQSGDFLVLPVVDQIGDHGWIGERGCDTQRTEIILGDLSQNPAHDLARPGLGQAGSCPLSTPDAVDDPLCLDLVRLCIIKQQQPLPPRPSCIQHYHYIPPSAAIYVDA